MLKDTPELKKAIQKKKTTREKLDILHNAYAGETCYMVTCGPSINEIWGDRVKHFLADKLVVSMKQAYDLAPEVMDFHLLNDWNYKQYAYLEPKPIILMQREEAGSPPTPGLVYDILLKLPKEAGVPEKLLARNRNFDDYLFTKVLDRPWGQGIVYEMGIYLAAHLGVSELVMVGWDIGDRDSMINRHFYDTHAAEAETRPGIAGLLKQNYHSLRSLGIDLAPLLALLPGRLRSRISVEANARRWGKTVRGQTMKVYNDPGLGKGEVELIAESTKDLYYWLQGKGIALKIVSDRSLADPCVPRIVL